MHRSVVSSYAKIYLVAVFPRCRVRSGDADRWRRSLVHVQGLLPVRQPLLSPSVRPSLPPRAPIPAFLSPSPPLPRSFPPPLTPSRPPSLLTCCSLSELSLPPSSLLTSLRMDYGEQQSYPSPSPTYERSPPSCRATPSAGSPYCSALLLLMFLLLLLLSLLVFRHCCCCCCRGCWHSCCRRCCCCQVAAMVAGGRGGGGGPPLCLMIRHSARI